MRALVFRDEGKLYCWIPGKSPRAITDHDRLYDDLEPTKGEVVEVDDLMLEADILNLKSLSCISFLHESTGEIARMSDAVQWAIAKWPLDEENIGDASTWFDMVTEMMNNDPNDADV